MAERWAVLVVHGCIREPKNHWRDLLAENLRLSETPPLEMAPDNGAAGDDAISLVPARDIAPAQSFERIELYEAYWGDLIPNPAEDKPIARLFDGFGLTFYWLQSASLWRAIFQQSVYIALGYLLSGVLLVVWLMSLIVTVLKSWIETGGVSRAAGEKLALIDRLLDGARDILQPIADHVSFEVGAALAIFIPLIPLMKIVDMAAFSRDYLCDTPDSKGIGIRARIRDRVRSSLVALLRRDFDRVVIVAHSFGTLVVADLMADWPDTERLKRIRVVTLGSPGAVLAHRSIWLRDQIAAALRRGPGLGWVDMYWHLDFWCSGLARTAIPALPAGAIDGREVRLDGSLWGAFNGATHLAYFRNDEVLSTVMERTPFAATA